MKKQEKILFYYIYNYPELNTNLILEILQRAGFNYKQMVYYLHKWVRLGFYEYGTNIELGWLLERKVPKRYLDILMEDNINGI